MGTHKKMEQKEGYVKYNSECSNCGKKINSKIICAKQDIIKRWEEFIYVNN